MEYEEAKKRAKAVKGLMKARADFDQLKKDEAKYLAERKEREQETLKEVRIEVRDALALLEELNGFIRKTFGFLDEIRHDTEAAREKFLEEARALKEEVEKARDITVEMMDEARRRMQKADNRTEELSGREAELREETKKVETLTKEADQKLKEAEDLAFWAKKPGAVYKDTRKSKK